MQFGHVFVGNNWKKHDKITLNYTLSIVRTKNMDCINIYHTVSNTFRARQLASLANFLVLVWYIQKTVIHVSVSEKVR